MPFPGPLRRSGRRSAAACASTRTRYEGYTVPPTYDSLVAKLIVSDDDAFPRPSGARRRRWRIEVEGMSTTLPCSGRW